MTQMIVDSEIRKEDATWTGMDLAFGLLFFRQKKHIDFNGGIEAMQLYFSLIYGGFRA